MKDPKSHHSGQPVLISVAHNELLRYPDLLMVQAITSCQQLTTMSTNHDHVIMLSVSGVGKLPTLSLASDKCQDTQTYKWSRQAANN